MMKFTALTPDEKNHARLFETQLRELLSEFYLRSGKPMHQAIRPLFEQAQFEDADPVFASHPVYRLQHDDFDAVLKFNDGTREASIAKYFQHDAEVQLAKPLFASTLDGATVTAMHYVDGHNLLDDMRYADVKDAVRQLGSLQDRTVDVEENFGIKHVLDDNQYYTNRVKKVFADQFMRISDPWLTQRQKDRLKTTFDTISQRYSVVEKRLRSFDTAAYQDLSPNNARKSVDGVTLIDVSLDRVLNKYLPLISLAEFGKKEISRFDLFTNQTEDLSKKEKESLLDVYLLEEKYQKTKDANLRSFIDSTTDPRRENKKLFEQYVTKQERDRAQLGFAYAGLQRHLEYTGYAARDINNAPHKKNEFHRQQYHMRKAVQHLKFVLKNDRDLTRSDRQELKYLHNSLNKANTIIADQNIPKQSLDDYLLAA